MQLRDRHSGKITALKRVGFRSPMVEIPTDLRMGPFRDYHSVCRVYDGDRGNFICAVPNKGGAYLNVEGPTSSGEAIETEQDIRRILTPRLETRQSALGPGVYSSTPSAII